MIPVLYVDDEKPLLELGKSFLEMNGQFTVDTTCSAIQALELLRSPNNYEAIISDYEMPGMNGIELLKSVRKITNNIPFILFTGRGREEIVIQALNEGADYYLQKGGDTVSLFVELSHKVRLAVDKRRSENALIQSEEQLRVLIDHIQDGVFLAQDGILLMSNEVQAAMLGYCVEEVCGMSITDLIAPEDRDLVLERHYNRLSGQKPPESYEYNLLHRDGKTRIPIRMSVGIGTYQDRPAVIGTLHCMAKEHERESALQKSERKYRDIYNNTGIGLFSSTLEGRFLQANPYAVRQLGYDSEEDFIQSIGNIGTQYVDVRDRDEIFRILNTKGFINSYETRFFRKDGSIIWGSISARLVSDEQGNTIIEGICQDITDRKEAEIELLESENRLRRVYDSGLIGIAYWNPDGIMTDANDMFLEILGYTRDELKAGLINVSGLASIEYTHPDKEAMKNLPGYCVEKILCEKEFTRKDGTKISVIIIGTILNEDNNQRIGFILDRTVGGNKCYET
ncbi:MAG: PAS domain S-box protein [Methanomicrobiales archaeon]|nr:PAS domain S-box protein [Methanomicrobiales archaeon]